MAEMTKREAVFGVTETERLLGHAQALAAFAGLKPGDVNDFCKAHKGFVPLVW